MSSVQSNTVGWIDSRSYDLIFIFGVLSLALLAGSLSVFNQNFQYLIFGMSLWFLSYHHVIAGFVKMAATEEDRKRNHFLIYYLPFITLTGVFLIAHFIGIWAVLTIYFYWQWYHYTRQSYGIAVYYHRQSPHDFSKRRHIAYATLWCVPIWGILHRSASMELDFFGNQIFFVPVPEVVVTIAAAVAIGLVANWVLQSIHDYMKGKLLWGHTLFMLSHHIIFFVSYVLIENPTIGWVTVMIWHNAQYMMFVWRDTSYRTGLQERSSIFKWLSERKPVRIMIYFMVTMTLTAIFYKSWHNAPQYLAQIVPSLNIGVLYFLVINQSINFHHYMIDAVMWKRKKT